jgi:hypothetical protein
MVVSFKATLLVATLLVLQFTVMSVSAAVGCRAEAKYVYIHYYYILIIILINNTHIILVSKSVRRLKRDNLVLVDLLITNVNVTHRLVE